MSYIVSYAGLSDYLSELGDSVVKFFSIVSESFQVASATTSYLPEFFGAVTVSVVSVAVVKAIISIV